MSLAIYITMVVLTSIFYTRFLSKSHYDRVDTILMAWVFGLIWVIVVPVHLLFSFYSWIFDL